MVPERFEDLLDAVARGEDDEDALAAAFRDEVVEDLLGAKRLLEDGQPTKARQALDEALQNARELLADGSAPAGSADGTRGGPADAPAYRVVLVDDNRTRRGLHRTLLEEAGPFDVVAEVDEDRRIVDAARAHAPDLVVWSLASPDEDRLGVLPDLQAAAPNVQVALLPEYTEEGFLACAQQAGADLCLEEMGGAALVDRLQSLVAEEALEG